MNVIEKGVGIIATVFGLLGSAFGAWIYIDNSHRDQRQAEIIKIDLDRNQKIRVFYERKEDEGAELSNADRRRYEQVIRDIERSHQKLDILEGK